MILARGSALFLYPLIPWSSVMLSSTPDHYTDEDKEPVHEPCAQLGFLVQVLVKVVLEEQIDGRNGSACQ